MSCIRVLAMGLAALLLAVSISPAAGAVTFTVNTTDDVDDGTCDAAHCSLREAVDAAQAGDTISFNIAATGPGYDVATGVWTLRPLQPYNVNTGVTVDGTTQGVNQGDTNPLGPEIEVDGSGMGGGYNCFRLTTGATLRGLVINRCGGYGVWVEGEGIVVAGNYIGTDPTGSEARAVGLDGVLVIRAQGNTIGGEGAGDRNVISGNGGDGIRIADVESEGNRVIGNYIGTDRTGSAALGNARGVRIHAGADGNAIGGSTPAERNVISGNDGNGLSVWEPGTDHNVIEGNYIGTAADGTAPLPNGTSGVTISDGPEYNVVGPGNVIAYNGVDGVVVDGYDKVGTRGNRITANSIHSNTGAGIFLSGGGNNELAAPVITAVGSASGTACPGCTVEVFSDNSDEGRTFEGSAVADGAGNWSFAGSVSGPKVTATATDSEGNTSAFSAPAGGAAKPGDADCDGDVDTVDSLMVLRRVAGLQPYAECINDANVKCDDAIDTVDALFILRQVAGLPVTLPPVCPAIG